MKLHPPSLSVKIHFASSFLARITKNKDKLKRQLFEVFGNQHFYKNTNIYIYIWGTPFEATLIYMKYSLIFVDRRLLSLTILSYLVFSYRLLLLLLYVAFFPPPSYFIYFQLILFKIHFSPLALIFLILHLPFPLLLNYFSFLYIICQLNQFISAKDQ